MDDGRVELTFLTLLTLGFKKWIKFYVPESDLIIEHAKITGIRGHPTNWENTLRSLNPESLDNFRKIIEKGMGKQLHFHALFTLQF